MIIERTWRIVLYARTVCLVHERHAISCAPLTLLNVLFLRSGSNHFRSGIYICICIYAFDDGFVNIRRFALRLRNRLLRFVMAIYLRCKTIHY